MPAIKNESYIELAVICIVILSLSAIGIMCYAESPLLRGSLDGILLVSVCLIMGIVFGVQMTAVVRAAGWLEKGRDSREKAVKTVQVDSSR
jgi:hypothetical protein